MYSPALPKLHEWYRLPDAEIFRVTDIQENQLQIQYPDGAFETVEMTIWNRLGAAEIKPDDEWLEAQEEPVKELDFLDLRMPPGIEWLEYMDILGDY